MDDLLEQLLSSPQVRKFHLARLYDYENVERKKDSLHSFDFYKNKHKDTMMACLCEEYGGDIERVKANRNIFSVNITKKIIDAISTVYIDEPERTFENATEDQASLLEDTYLLTDIEKALKKANKYYNLDHQCLIKIIPVNGEIRARVLPRHMYDVIEDPMDCEKAIAIITTRLRPGAKKDHINVNSKPDPEDYIYTWWTDTANFETDADGDIIGEVIDNPIGRMPFIEVSKDKDHDYWVEEGCGVVEFAKEFLLCLCDVANIAKLQGFAQAVLASESKPEDLMIGPNNYIHLQLDPTSQVQPSFDFASPNPDLNASLSFLEKMLAMFLTSINVDPATVSSSGQAQRYTSGLDRFLAGVERYESSRDTLTLFRSVEEEVFEVLRLWLNALQGTEGQSESFVGPLIDDNVDLVVSFAQPQLVQTEREKCDIIITKLNAGLLSKTEAIAYDREVSLESAEEIAQAIMEQQREPIPLIESSDDEE